ncbi:hypothetical protein [Pedobacter heparinus]|uniref:hypothetical protein n=1 Tax=Pedobacter heparinus TaxID=984 RepID=UPI002931C7F7|nr:hypothetical protein [Pedobacter heparinus]
MENYTVVIGPEHQHHFQVGQYLHHATGGCKYKIFQNGNFVASLESDGQDFLHVCQNPGGIDLEILHLLAEQIESRHPNARHFGTLENIEFDSDDELEAPPQKTPVD